LFRPVKIFRPSWSCLNRGRFSTSAGYIEHDRSHWKPGSHLLPDVEEKLSKLDAEPDVQKIIANLISAGKRYCQGSLENGMVPQQPLRARELLERALSLAEDHYGRQHLVVGQTLSSLAIVYRYLRPVDTKADLGGLRPGDRVVSINGASCQSENDIRTAMKKPRLGLPASTEEDIEGMISMFLDLGQRERIRVALVRAVPILETQLGLTAFETCQARCYLGGAYLEFHEFEKAVDDLYLPKDWNKC